MTANTQTGTRVDEVARGIYRISTPLDVTPGGFTFNSYLVDDDEPLLFHTGLRKLKNLAGRRQRWTRPVGRRFGASECATVVDR